MREFETNPTLNKIDFENLVTKNEIKALSTKHDSIIKIMSKNYFKLRNELLNIHLPNISNTLSSLSDSTMYLTEVIESLNNEIPNINADLNNIKKRTESLYSRYISSEEIPDDAWRIYAGINYGFQNRPENSVLFKLGLKSLFINDKIHFDLAIISNNRKNTDWLDQINLNGFYRLYTRSKPYFSIDIGGGLSYGVTYNRIDNFTKDENSVGLNFEAYLTGKIIKDKLFLYFNASDRFVFGGKGYNYGMPIFGIGITYNLYLKSSFIKSLSNYPFLKDSEKQIIHEVNKLRSHPKRYLNDVEQYLDYYENNPDYVGKEDEYMSVKVLYDSLEGVKRIISVDTVLFVLPQETDSLKKDLKSERSKNRLIPHQGIYYIAKKLAMETDQADTVRWWTVDHMVSVPQKLINKHARGYILTNSIVLRNPQPSARDIICQLLIDGSNTAHSGIKYPVLDSDWTHIAVYDAGLKNGLYRYLLILGKLK